MALFFSSLATMQAFSLHPQLCCSHCGLDDQLVSHGFVYRKQPQGLPLKNGKRLLCSNRAARSGCGHTVRLYLAHSIPRCHYPAEVFYAFLLALLQGSAIGLAYQQATSRAEPRHAWRWLQRLYQQLPAWRAHLTLKGHPALPLTHRSTRLQALLPSFFALTAQRTTGIATLQVRWQQPFC